MVRREPDAEAFSEFVTVRSGSLFRTAYLMIGDYHLAQDLVQEALIKAYAGWPRLRGVADVVGTDPSVLFDKQEELWRELQMVPPRQRAAVVLRFCETFPRSRPPN